MAGKDSQKTEGTSGPKYPLEEFLANSEILFKCKPEVILGALHGITKIEFTVDEIRGIIEKFLKRRVS